MRMPLVLVPDKPQVSSVLLEFYWASKTRSILVICVRRRHGSTSLLLLGNRVGHQNVRLASSGYYFANCRFQPNASFMPLIVHGICGTSETNLLPFWEQFAFSRVGKHSSELGRF